MSHASRRSVALAVAWRTLHNVFTTPAILLPSLIFPLVFFTAFAGGLSQVAKLPGFHFPAGYTAFQFVFALLQSAAFGGVFTGFSIARDFETGFLNRLSLTPLRSSALIAGHLAGVVVFGFLQSDFYLVVGVALGVDIQAGVGGAFVLLLLATVIAAGFGALGAWLALEAGSGEAVQGMFPLLFVAFFLSSMNTPRNLIQLDWFRAIATANPVSYLIECVRSLIITCWDGEALALGFGIALVISIVAFALASHALKERMAR